MQNGFILIFDEEKRTRRLNDFAGSNEPFSEALSSADHDPKKREVFIFSFDGKNIHSICLGERKKKVVTFKYRVEFTNFIEIEPPLSIDTLQGKLEKGLHSHFIRVSKGNGSRVPPKTWEKLISLIKKERPEIAKKIDDLYTLRNGKYYEVKNRHIETFKQDATTLSLKFSGIDTKTADFICVDENGNAVTETPAFLDGLKPRTYREDRMIFHDVQLFADWKKDDVRPGVTARFTDGNKALTIQNYNREPVETTLGVDLMYYNEFYNSFILIQYKAFEQEPGEKVFRLSSHGYESGYERMTTLQKYLESIQAKYQQISNYRFHSGACYFKLCDRDAVDLGSNEMIKGMYLPLDYWDKLVNDVATLGKMGGRFVSYQNVGRYFNNTQFIELVKEGWIGTTVTQSSELLKIINEILNAGRTVIFADLRKVD